MKDERNEAGYTIGGVVPDIERFDRNVTNDFTIMERLRFRWARALFDVLVMRAIGRAYERSIIASRQMHEIVAIWKRMRWPERPWEKELFDPREPTLEPRWYRRAERDPITPCVFATFGDVEAADGKKVRYFTNVYGEDRAAIDSFIASKIWTHWHPLASIPRRDDLQVVADQMAAG
jgi:hypothetical protein